MRIILLRDADEGWQGVAFFDRLHKKNETGEPIGCLCINFDVSELLDFMIQESIKMIGKPVFHMTREEKYRVISYLDEKGAFLITKSGFEFGIGKQMTKG